MDTIDKKTYLINVQSNLDKYAKEAVTAGKAVDTLEKENKKLVASGKASKEEIEKSNAALRNAKKEYKEATKLVDLQTAANKSNINSRKELNAIVTLEQRRLGALANTYTINEKGVRTLSATYLKQAQALSQAKGAVIAYDQAQKDGRSNIGRYSQSFVSMGKNILQTMGIFASAAIVVRAFFNVIKQGFKTSFDFEKAMAAVRAIARATKEEFNALRTSAIALGSSTKFTAIEVAALQKEYAKLGFTTAEILKITKGTLDLAAATGSDLASSAAIAGATLRQFSLDATQMNRVVDVMALSFSSSALDMEKFKTAMASAGPVAKAVGETIESTTAKLAVLANSGLDASTAGTSLRNIFLELERKGLTWNEAMTKIQTAQNKAATSLQLFGKRGAVAGLVLSDNTKLLKELTTAFGDAGGAAKTMADIMLDNVSGSATILKSAWEGLILRTNESNGALKDFLDMLTNVVTAINTKGKPAIDSMFDVRKIETFSDKWKFYAAQGVGFWNTLGNSILRSKQTTQEYSDSMSIVMEKEKAREDEINVIRLKGIAEEKRIAEERLRLHENAIDAAILIEETEVIKAGERAIAEIEALRDLVNAKKYIEIQFAEETGAGMLVIHKKYAAAEVEIAKLTIDEKFALASNFAGNLAQIFGENTAIGKAAAIAQTTISTYKTAQGAFESFTAPPVAGPLSVPLGFVAAAAAVAAGIANVKKILAVKSGLPGDTGGGSAPTAISASMPAMRLYAPPAGATFLTQPQLTQPQINALPGQNLLTAADIAAAISKLPHPIVTVEDINAKTASVRKIEVRGNI